MFLLETSLLLPYIYLFLLLVYGLAHYEKVWINSVYIITEFTVKNVHVVKSLFLSTVTKPNCKNLQIVVLFFYTTLQYTKRTK